MALKSVFISVLFFVFVGHAETTGLIVAIDQQTLSNVSDNDVQQWMRYISFNDPKLFGPLCGPIKLLKANVGSIHTVTHLIKAWDECRKEWIQDQASLYTHVYVITGEQVRDDEYMDTVWVEALANNDVIDFISLVQGDDQPIKDAWRVQANNQIRLVYSEADFGSDRNAFNVDAHGAWASVGYAGVAAGPLFSCAFLTAWFVPSSLEHSIRFAAAHGRNTLNSNRCCEFVKLFCRYKTKEEALLGSELGVVEGSTMDKP